MPIEACTLPDGGDGFRWGGHGKCYATRAEAEKQAEAAYANGYAGDAALAFDKSVRTVDQDGRLHIAVANISKANVCPYLGHEIPDFAALGLDAGHVYRLLRDPEELRKAAPTFNNIPVLSRHVPVSVADHRPDLVVGSTGTDAAFEAPYLRNSMVVWEAVAIAGIETGAQRELSCAYRYEADMKPGTYDGVEYDGVMRNLKGNHVALVEDGRAGSDVVVGDSNPKEFMMPKANVALSRKAALAKGALAIYLRPKLAQDARIDLTGILKAVTARNWTAQKPVVRAALVAATKGKLAQDADIADVVELLDTLDSGKGVDDMEDMDAMDDDPEKKATEPARDADPMEALMAFLKGKLSDEDCAKVADMMKPQAGAMDNPPPTPGTPKPPVAEVKKDSDAPTKSAMDAAIAAAVQVAERNTIARLKAIRDAEELVRPFIGALAMAQDSAEAVHRLALDHLGIDVTGVHPSAYPAILKLQPKPGEAAKPRMAADARTADQFTKLFPDAPRVKHL